MNPLIGGGILLNGLLGLAVAVAEDVPGWLGGVMLALWALSVVGAVLVFARHERAGARFVIVGCIGFVPAGFVGIIGARRVLAG